MELLIFILVGGIPYYFLFEILDKKNKNLSKYFPLFSNLLIIGLLLRFIYQVDFSYAFIIISLISTLITAYKAIKTSNLYKLAYYFLFLNSSIFLLIDIKYSIYYAVALIITCVGLYFVGNYYKNNYGSANFSGISGLALESPIIGFVLRIYLISLALYPPFPNAVFLFNSFIKNETSYIWYIVFGIVFFTNFLIAMRVLTNTVFGKPNKYIFYKDILGSEKFIHFFIIFLLTIWGINGIMEVLNGK
ncbi:hypothetical protein [Hydrogenothermus marinus]|uniref:Uncharacterized protein n=1 Tax=Hydrogenothermus marinus TaxID=133270 RepID=A0A3M0BQL3_9AQUI|nr:hypothetical protein [Hydrogenothermus marinus]RMA97118.1 hypothetical protein CLV39_0773 [Hydrogenothermus marinus]